jgi:magnesium chelatase subunit D
MNRLLYPFAAVVGQDNFRKALLLAAIDPSLGGVLVMGDKGSGKTTTVRGLADLMHGAFINLPVGATEDRVLGSVDLEHLINHRQLSIQQGLLARAHNGLLYIDEINLLNDYIMDTLLDASASGGYYLERDGLSAWQDSRFILVGTMNPEEGQLRPQLLDRFGLCVRVFTSSDPAERAEITRRRLSFDTDAIAFTRNYAGEMAVLRSSIAEARAGLHAVAVPENSYRDIAALCLAAGAEGMRADILILKAARALAALQRRDSISLDDIREVAPLVLLHRSKEKDDRQSPQQERNKQQNPQQEGDKQQSPDTPLQEYLFKANNTTQRLQLPRNTPSSAPAQNTKPLPASTPAAQAEKKNLLATVRHYLLHQRCRIHYHPHQKEETCLLLLVDSSHSMASASQISQVKGLLAATLKESRYRQVKIALVALMQGAARLVSGFTDNKERILQLLDGLPTGGKTNLKAGFEAIDRLVLRQHEDAHLYIFTDGRINAGGRQDPFAEAISFFQRQLHHLRSTTCIINTETGFSRLGMARQLATALHVNYKNL